MAGAAQTKQDMPPKGGYGPIDYSRKLFKRIPGKYILGGVFGVTAYSWWLICETRRYNKMLYLENTEANIALEPLIMAENDRLTLKLFRQNCELEEELMQDDPDWKTGTIFGVPMFFDTRNRGIMPIGTELYNHTNARAHYLLDRQYHWKAMDTNVEWFSNKNPTPAEQ
ncbi:NADH dehydrogenase [ubiquinone] 1 alpha subcomplex subunit 13-like [Saccostrea cucullata]|uniref:NADH dehydrogenase [ubiquinone] 1 alpha subcomplex subunit 13-like n=1 Tax=Saccostrea cuccullata TaxID=36930 RepID=UPI002ED41255